MGEMREVGSVLWKMARTIGIRECHWGSLCAKRPSPDQRRGMVCTVTETLTEEGKHMFLLVLFLPLPLLFLHLLPFCLLPGPAARLPFQHCLQQHFRLGGGRCARTVTTADRPPSGDKQQTLGRTAALGPPEEPVGCDSCVP